MGQTIRTSRLGAELLTAEQQDFIVAAMNELGQRRSNLIYNIQQFAYSNGWSSFQLDSVLEQMNPALWLLQVSFQVGSESPLTFAEWQDRLAQAAAIYDQVEATYQSIIPNLTEFVPTPTPIVPAPTPTPIVPAPTPTPIVTSGTVTITPTVTTTPAEPIAETGGFDFGPLSDPVPGLGIPLWMLLAGVGVGLFFLGRR